MIKFLPILAASAFAFSSSPAVADDAATLAPTQVLPSAGDEISLFRNAGAWSIHKNTTRKSCFASYESETGEVVQFGFTDNEKVGYLGLFSQRAEVEESDQEVSVIVNGNLYVGEATGTGANLSDGYQGGYLLVNNPEFIKDVEAGQELVAFPEMPNMYIVDMKGAKNAVYEVRKCTQEMK